MKIVVPPSETGGSFSNYVTASQEATGFTNQKNINLSYNSTTRKITLTGTFEAFYLNSKVMELTDGWQSPAHPDVQATYYLYYRLGTFYFDTNPWKFSDLMIALVQYNSHKLALRECHGAMPHLVHEEFHQTIGCYKIAGGDLSSYVLNSTTAVNRRPDVSTTEVKDEDLESVLTALTTKSYTQRYLTGAGIRSFNLAQAEIVPVNGTVPYYNQNVAGTWQQTAMSNNEYGAIFLVAIPTSSDTESLQYRYMWVQPQQVSASIDEIRNLTPSNLTHGTSASLVSEFVFFAKVIIRVLGGNWSIVEVTKLEGTKISQVAYSPTADVGDTSWSVPTFTGTWVNYGAPYNTAGYRKTASGFVHLRGGVKSGTINTAVFTLPVGYRPEATEMIVTNSNGAFARVQIDSAGVVTALTTSNVHFSLDGITFKAV